MDLSHRLSYMWLRNAQDIEFVELMFDGGRYDIPKRGRGFFSRDFHPPPMFPAEKLSLLVGRRESSFGFSSQTVSDCISVSSIEILSKFRGQGVHKKSGKVTITLGDLSVTLGVILQTEQTLRLGELQATTPSVLTNPEARQLTLLPVVASQPSTMASPLRLSYVELQNAQGLESVALQLNGAEHPINQSQEKKDTFLKNFDMPLTLENEPLSLSIRRKKPWFSSCFCCGRTVPETVTIRFVGFLFKLNGQELLHEWNKISIKLRFLPQTQPGVTASSVPANPVASQSTTEQPIAAHSTSVQNTARSADTPVAADIPAPVNALAPPNREDLRPTTDDLIQQCPRFRVLIVGKSGVGKSTLINRIFGLEVAHVAKDRPGQAAIEKELISQENNRFILHDSRGFEPAEGSNYDVVKSFIEERKRMPDVKDQLHAVWLCFQVPILKYGERLLEDGVEAFLREAKEALGNIPTIVVFTKYDRLVSFVRKKKSADPEAEAKRYLQTYCIEPIQDFTGGTNISHVAASSKHKCERGLEELINLTQEKVSKNFASPGNAVSPVHLAAVGAQRMFPTLKVDLSIDVGKQRYWKALGTSASFPGHTMQDCLGVIHTDIVAVWNFYDPCQYLNSEEFRRVMMYMVERVDAPAESNSLSRTDTLAGGVPLIALAPVMLPSIFSLGKWVLATYQRLQGVPTKFMAYIVDLTHVLEILFSLTADMGAKKLTRTAIKLAYQAYNGSEWMTRTHTGIRLFECSSVTRDVVLERIISMMSSDDREVLVSRALETIPRVDLERDEEWTGEGS
ncbi:hypothetical protein BKA82DRAFT_994155 [Pisolithus tinctorius]|uniref:G domain-containing protein n=1 Tax=Pisolithus tinctorius Marx 270 TaxID=870435 RepID=A0A0C3JSQ7_PISTI|nr:hypothetical protein BKA82DRAFT_994155 [Pisolithus tinctorius]KIO12183.1 hypothetical protein M404DRAFT_994155 [Pisolithus tinctorius Marx 270]